MHNYLAQVAQPFSLPQGHDVISAWSDDVPRLALEYENLLYAVLAVSATHLLRSHPNDPILLTARASYMVLALGAQSKAIENLSGNNVDAACFTSLHSYQLLWDAAR
jgi:hypothetical protein